jgi:hypothetical protein
MCFSIAVAARCSCRRGPLNYQAAVVSRGLFTLPRPALPWRAQRVDAASRAFRGGSCLISRKMAVVGGTFGVLGRFIQTRRAAATPVNGTSHPMTGARHHDRAVAGGSVLTIAASNA